jgi:hypothetical protein
MGSWDNSRKFWEYGGDIFAFFSIFSSENTKSGYLSIKIPKLDFFQQFRGRADNSSPLQLDPLAHGNEYETNLLVEY